MVRRAVIIVLTLAAVGTVLLWVDSYRLRPSPDANTLRRGPGTDWLLSSDMSLHIDTLFGIIYVSYAPTTALEYRPAGGRHFSLTKNFSYDRFEGIRIGDPSRTVVSSRYARFPFSLLFVVVCAYPAILAIAFIRGPLRRWRRRRKGLCVKCAYDLTGNVSGVCPECGVEV